MPKVTTVTDTTHCKIASLSGYGDDYFKDQYLFVQRDNGGAGAAPQGEQAKVSDYTGADGTFQHEAFTAGLAVDDDIVVMHQILVDPKNDIVKVGGTSQTGADLVPLFQHLDTDLSRVSLGANVAQNRVNADYGLDMDYTPSGTPVPASTTNTPLNISGFGKLHHILFLTDITSSLMQCKVLVDGNHLADAYGYTAGIGFIHDQGLIPGSLGNIVNYDAGNSDYALELNPYILGGGSFGASCVVSVQNYDGSNPHNARISIWYLVSASKKFSITDPTEKDVVKVREELASRLGIDPEGICAIYQENWDEEKRLNVPSLSTIVHPRLTKAGEDEVREFLQARRVDSR